MKRKWYSIFLIIVVFTSILGGIKIYMNYQSKHDYYFSRHNKFPVDSQQIAFWNSFDSKIAEQAGAEEVSTYTIGKWVRVLEFHLTEPNDGTYEYVIRGDDNNGELNINYQGEDKFSYSIERSPKNFKEEMKKWFEDSDTDLKKEKGFKSIRILEEFQDKYYKLLSEGENRKSEK